MMHKALLLFALITIMSTSPAPAFAQYSEYQFKKSEDVTSEDLPLDFQIEKTEWQFGRVRIWGYIKNTDSRPHSFVKVIFTAKDFYGNLINRQSTFTRPYDIGPGQVGYIEDYGVDCGGIEPGYIEYKVLGR